MIRHLVFVSMLKRRWILENIGKKLGVKTFEDWYQIKKYQLKKLHGILTRG